MNFGPDTPEWAIFREWWKWLQVHPGDRAELRRCQRLEEVLLCPAYYNLRNRLARVGKVYGTGLAAVAGLAAHVKEDSGGESLARQLGMQEGDKPRMSGLRFRRLLQARNHPSLYVPLIRAIRLLDRRVSLQGLARGVYWWNDGTKRRWAEDYYAFNTKD